jgi:hypothetical protein
MMVDSEDALQISIHKMLTLTSKLAINISTNRTRTMACKGTDPVRSNIVINNTVTEQRTISVSSVALFHIGIKNT